MFLFDEDIKKDMGIIKTQRRAMKPSVPWCLHG
jgi:hypothetical protein